MGAPEVLIALFLVGVPAMLVWCIVSLARSHRPTPADRPDPDHDDFWDRP